MSTLRSEQDSVNREPNSRSSVSPVVLSQPVHLLALGFGAGLSPFAPGTAGTLVAIVVYLLIAALPDPWYLAAVGALFVVGVWACGASARDLGEHDHRAIVWDEIVGFLVTAAALPPGWVWLLAAFALFRVFDILKPWPIRLIDRRVHGGLGIMLDDVLAGLYGLAILQGAWLLIGTA